MQFSEADRAPPAIVRRRPDVGEPRPEVTRRVRTVQVGARRDHQSMRGAARGTALAQPVDVQEHAVRRRAPRQHRHRPHAHDVVDVMTEIEDVIVREHERRPRLDDVADGTVLRPLPLLRRRRSSLGRLVDRRFDGNTRIHRQGAEFPVAFAVQREKARRERPTGADVAHFRKIHSHVPQVAVGRRLVIDDTRDIGRECRRRRRRGHDLLLISSPRVKVGPSPLLITGLQLAPRQQFIAPTAIPLLLILTRQTPPRTTDVDSMLSLLPLTPRQELVRRFCR